MSVLEHQPVLLAEVMAALNLDANGYYLDATFGRGGHSANILKQLNSAGKLFAVDKDPQAIEYAQRHFAQDQRFDCRQSSFDRIDQAFADLSANLDGILFDFGVSSPQLDQAQRGFSFLRDGPLDMRMDTTGGDTAATWLARAEEWEMKKVFRQYGEERYAGRIARAIINERNERPLETTAQLAQLIKQVVPTREHEKHPATRVFQAIRIRINSELEEIAGALPLALKMLKPGGRLAVISFHSLEDRIVKRFFRQQAKGDDFPQDLPVTAKMLNPTLKLIGKPIKASAGEVRDNPRARSAILRVAEKLACQSDKVMM